MNYGPYITEKFSSGVQHGGKYYEIFENPDPQELRDINNTSFYRAIIIGKNIFVWDADGPLHYEVASHLRKRFNDTYPIIINAKKNVISMTGDLPLWLYNKKYKNQEDGLRDIQKNVLNNPWVRQTLGKVELDDSDVQWIKMTLGESITEKFVKGVPGSVMSSDYVEIFVNPTMSELKEAEKQNDFGMVRGLLDGTDVYVFSADLLHADAISATKAKRNSIGLVFQMASKSIRIQDFDGDKAYDIAYFLKYSVPAMKKVGLDKWKFLDKNNRVIEDL